MKATHGDLHNIRERAFQMLCALDLTEKKEEGQVPAFVEDIKELFLNQSEEQTGGETGGAQGSEGAFSESSPEFAAPEEFCAGSCSCWHCSMEIFHSACAVARGVLRERAQIDALIEARVVNWRTDRMSAVDRSVIRLAVYESLFAKTAPVAVAINEAVNLAKEYGSDDSGRFVNGVLARIVRESQ